MAKNWDKAPKDPQDVRDYGIDWTDDIGDATIVGSTWTVAANDDSEIVLGDGVFTDTTTAIRLSGGVAGTTARITNHVVLSNGEEADQSGNINIIQR